MTQPTRPSGAPRRSSLTRWGWFPIPVLLLFLAPAVVQGGLSREVGARAMPAVVYILGADLKGGRIVPIAVGSGSILTPEGHILTNHHVIYNDKAKKLFDAAVIGRFKRYDEAPELTCIARPANATADSDLDLAVLRCETGLDGKPMEVRGWPTLPVGSSEELQPGSSEIFVIGYPGVGGSTIHVTRGTVSGFVGRDGGAGRFWVKTDAAIAHGNSGGAAIDEEGRLVGVPTAVYAPGTSDIGEKVGLVRPIELARDIIGKGGVGGGVTVAPGLDPGVTRCALTSGVVISGRVMNAVDKSPIEGAFVVVLKPGRERRVINDDYSNIDEHVFVWATTDQSGAWEMPCPVARDARYTVMVVAKGYRELAADGVLDTRDAPPRWAPWDGQVYLSPAE